MGEEDHNYEKGLGQRERTMLCTYTNNGETRGTQLKEEQDRISQLEGRILTNRQTEALVD